MAERYGEKPRIFTKEWWSYYWMYYKWHSIAVAFVLMLVTVGVTECVKRDRYDLDITYLGNTYYDDEMWNSALENINECIYDADGNGKTLIGFQSLIVSNEAEYAEQSYAAYIKHDASMADEFSYLYIYDGTELEKNSEDDFISENFFKASAWSDSEISEDMLVYYGDDAYAVSLKNSAILKNAGIDCENLYLLVKYDGDMKNVNDTARENAFRAANKLIK